MSGIPVVISENGFGLPVRQVDSGAPVMTVADNGFGMPIVLSDRGTPYVVQGGAPSLLPLSSRVVFAENSYGAQANNVDYITYAMMRCGWRPALTIGTKQARGGDRQTHLHDRRAPMTAQRAALAVIMDLENDYADATVPNTTGGGDTLAARTQQIATDFDAAYSGAKLIARLSANTNGYNGKSVAGARAKEVIAANSRLQTFDTGAFFNPQDATQSTDGVHPNTLKSAKALGNALGDVLASNFVADEIFDAGAVLPNAVNASAFNPATAWTATVNTSGLVAAQSTGFLRSKPSVPCRVFTYTGTSGQDPTLGTTVPDHQLRLTIPLVARDTFAMVMASLMLMEITSASGGDPVGLATIQINNGFGQTFNKQLTTAHGLDQWDTKYQGVMGVMPALVVGQTASVSFDIRVRGKQGVAADFEIRIANLNMISTEDAAYGPAASMSAPFTVGDGTNRPYLATQMSSSPAAGGSIAVGATYSVVQPGVFVGGGLTRSWDVMRDQVTDVGNYVPITRLAAAVPYTTVAQDSTHTLNIRANASNAMGSDIAVTGTIAVT